MKVKTIYTSLLLGAVLMAACDSVDYPDRFVQTSGVPTVDFIRYANKDVVITQANMEEIVCIVGDNLTSIHDIYFNDQPAILNTSFITAKTLVVAVPKTMPVEETNKIYLITKDGKQVTYDFKVLPPAPKISTMSLEWANPGETVTINGSYLFAPVEVEFPGCDPVTATAGDGNSVEVVIPQGAQPGKIKVNTSSGTAQSTFMYKDSRGMLFNFDNDPHPDNHGWHAQVIETDETALSGNFLRLGGADVTLDAEGGWKDGNFSFEYWPGDWDDPVTYADSPLLTDFADFSDWKNMALKFELYIPTSNPWMAGAMQIFVGGVDVVTGGAAGAVDIFGNTLAGANNTFISGNEVPRALYIPWKDTGSFDTGNKWITVTIPYSTFLYDSVGNQATGELNASSFTSLTIFVWNGGVTGTDCQPIIKIDNIRAVPYK
ncbi:MAG: hypothetical protein IKW99_09065 [Bacteroidales bacterium]|nr:hypothetical protein [Bacteroidales bacterium]